MGGYLSPVLMRKVPGSFGASPGKDSFAAIGWKRRLMPPR
jgi:hypothetical protein